MENSRALRLMLALLLISCGAVLVLVAGAGKAGNLVNGLGLSLIVSGIVAVFRELAIAHAEGKEMADQVATRLRAELSGGGDGGLRRVSSPQRGYDGYYLWAVSKEQCDLFFAGRSVLHRVQAELAGLSLGRVEDLFLGKLQQDSVIRVLFLDPRSDLVSRLCQEEGQSEREFLEDMAISLGICRRIHKLITEKRDSLSPHAELHIRIYDELPHFSYHRHDEVVVVGLYLVSSLGSPSAAFQVADDETKKFFSDHFTAMFDRAADRGCIVDLTYNGRTPVFSDKLYEDLRDYLAEKLGHDECRRLMDAD